MKDLEIFYFGTDLHNHGHYKWKVTEDDLISIRGWDLPFEQQEFTKTRNDNCYHKGDMQFIQQNGYSIIYIEGSCVDDRWGTESTFFIRQDIKRDEFWNYLKSLSIVQQMIIKMSFKLQWLKN